MFINFSIFSEFSYKYASFFVNSPPKLCKWGWKELKIMQSSWLNIYKSVSRWHAGVKTQNLPWWLNKYWLVNSNAESHVLKMKLIIMIEPGEFVKHLIECENKIELHNQFFRSITQAKVKSFPFVFWKLFYKENFKN